MEIYKSTEPLAPGSRATSLEKEKLHKGTVAFPSTYKVGNPWDKPCTFLWHTNLESATNLNKIHH